MFRYSLATFLIFVLMVSIGAAALAHPTARWSEIVVTLTVTVLMVASLAAVLWRNRAQAFVIGFALCGWTYFLLVFVAALGLRDELLTDDAVNWLYAAMHEREEEAPTEFPLVSISDNGRLMFGAGIDSDSGVTGSLVLDDGNFVRMRTPSQRRQTQIDHRRHFSHVAHALCALLIACLGGAVGRLVYLAEHAHTVEPRAVL